MALSSDIKVGGSLWSAVARYRFGSPFRYCGNDGREPTAGLLYRKSVESGDDYQSGTELPHSKASPSLTLNLMLLSGGDLAKLLILCLVALCGVGCRAEKAQDIRPAERVELLALDENDPRPYFHAELKFANPEQVKLPTRSEELQKLIKVREAGSLFMRE